MHPSALGPLLPEALLEQEQLKQAQHVMFPELERAPLQVYKAQYLECDVAVKKLNRVNDAKSDEAFRREAAILKGCRNPYIVNFMGVCKDEVHTSVTYMHGPMHAGASGFGRRCCGLLQPYRASQMTWELLAQAGRICLVTELMDTSLMSALSLSDDENKAYQYYAE